MYKDLNIYVLQHKQYENKHTDLENRVPLQVGAWNKPHFCTLVDCMGDNISNKNALYCETTGHYWVLKNDIQSKYVGFEHCSRQFLPLKTKEQIMSIMDKYDIITAKPIEPESTVFKFYSFCHNFDDLLVCKDVLCEMDEDLGRNFEDYIFNSNVLYYSNIFITKWEVFEDMYNFVFNVLKMYEERKGFKRLSEWEEYAKKNSPSHDNYLKIHPDTSRGEYQMRICGFLAERLYSFYIIHKNLKTYEIPVVAEKYD